MKCPDCGLVTFDHLSRCPKCRSTFRLARRLTRRPDPNRRIVLPPSRPADSGSPAPAATDAPDAEPSGPHEPAADGPGAEPIPEHPAPAPTSGTPPRGSERVAIPVTPSIPEAPPPTDRAVLDAEMLAPAPTDSAFRTEVRNPTTRDPDAPATRKEDAPAGTVDPRPAPETEASPAESASRAAQPVPTGPRRRADAEHAEDRRRLKERMIAASRKRRGRRAAAESGSVDPLLPAWYLPETDHDEAESEPATGSGTE